VVSYVPLQLLHLALTAVLTLILFRYPRHSIILRFGLFYSFGSLAGAFGGLLARGLVEMDGLGGLEGWRYDMYIHYQVFQLMCRAVS
jgi:hypothetical protein